MSKKALSFQQYMNNAAYLVMYNKFKNIALNVFTWEGLPENITEEYIEKYLFEHGKCMIFADPALKGVNVLPCVEGLGVDVHGYPLHYRAQGYAYTRQYHRDNCVVIINNKTRTATKQILLFYVREIVDVMRTTSVNVKTMKAPFIVTGDEDTINTFKALMNEIDDNEFAAFVDKAFDVNSSINVLQTGAKFWGKDLLAYRQALENELLAILGVNSVPYEKKERLNTAEVESNNEQVSDFVQIMLNERERACEQMNKMFNLDVKVSLRNKTKEDGTNVSQRNNVNS